ncbi:MAG TPA: DUF6798 domain-containing protein [Phycisphaerae bacterium]|nr:DUF6798 domain-containing protein [Phycisphaerae bacterium]
MTAFPTGVFKTHPQHAIRTTITALSRITPRQAHLATCFCVGAAAAGFALHNGMQVRISNHCQYLLHGLHAADPSFLVGDWFVTQTPDHHRVFSSLVRLLAHSNFLDQGLGLLNGIAAIGFITSLYFIVARFTQRPFGPFAALLILVAFMPVNGPGHSSILLPYFVPSVFSGVCLLIALTCLLYRRSLTAGVIAALGCAVHANYLVLVGPVWLLFVALNPRGEKGRLAPKLFVPWAIASLPHLSLFGSLAADESLSALSKHIFWNIYAPLHYAPASWPADWYLPFATTILAGLIAWRVRPKAFTATARRIVTSVGLVLLVGIIAILGVQSDFANALFPWRLAPFLTIVAYVAIAMLFDAEGMPLGAGRMIATACAIGLLAISGFESRAIVLLFALYGLHLLGSFLSPPIEESAKAHASIESRMVSGRRLIPLEAASMAVLLLLAAFGVRSGMWRQDIFQNNAGRDETTLFEWSRSTPTGTRFAVPPDLVNFRLETGRAVVIDFKSFPFTATHQVEWMRRHERQAGDPVLGYHDAVEKYAVLDAGRALDLALEFGINYVVIDRTRHVANLAPLSRVFRNDRFDVYEATPLLASRP